MISVSIIIPCLNEEKYIKNCIDSILESDLSPGDWEVLFIDGGSSDRTIEMIDSFVKKYNFVRLLHNPSRYTPISMNIGIKNSNGKYLFILSAHAEYEKSYFRKLVNCIKELDAECVGGKLLTEVKNKSKKSNSIKEILTHRFGVGNATFRTGSNGIKEVDTVAFGCYKREVFQKYGYYDERLVRNQDIELNKRIVNNGGKIYLIPEVSCTYYARETFTELAKNSFANGFWNIMTAYYTKTFNSLSPRHFVPLFFILSLLLPLFFSVFYPKLIWLFVISLLSYLTLVIIISLKMKNSFNSVYYLINSFLVLHISYGLGSLAGIFKVISKYIKGKK